jgi:hypothetical protein
MCCSRLLILALMSAGCARYTVMTSPDVNSPVTLGPVTRVGGACCATEKTVASVSGEASDFAAATRQEERVGNTVTVKHETTRISTNGADLSARIMSRTENKFDRETRVDVVDTGAYAFITTGSAMFETWVGVKGRVVEVNHAR